MPPLPRPRPPPRPLPPRPRPRPVLGMKAAPGPLSGAGPGAGPVGASSLWDAAAGTGFSLVKEGRAGDQGRPGEARDDSSSCRRHARGTRRDRATSATSVAALRHPGRQRHTPPTASAAGHGSRLLLRPLHRRPRVRCKLGASTPRLWAVGVKGGSNGREDGAGVRSVPRPVKPPSASPAPAAARRRWPWRLAPCKTPRSRWAALGHTRSPPRRSCPKSWAPDPPTAAFSLVEAPTPLELASSLHGPAVRGVALARGVAERPARATSSAWPPPPPSPPPWPQPGHCQQLWPEFRRWGGAA